MKLAILDDYMKVALASADWEGICNRGVEITVFDTAFASVEDAAVKLAPFEIVNLLRERTHFSRALIERLPNLKFIAMTGRRAPSLDLAAATERRIPVSNTHGGGYHAQREQFPGSRPRHQPKDSGQQATAHQQHERQRDDHDGRLGRFLDVGEAGRGVGGEGARSGRG